MCGFHSKVEELPHRRNRRAFSPQLEKRRELTAERKISLPEEGGSQHRVCLVCGNAAARLPHTFRAEARTHFIYVLEE